MRSVIKHTCHVVLCGFVRPLLATSLLFGCGSGNQTVHRADADAEAETAPSDSAIREAAVTDAARSDTGLRDAAAPDTVLDSASHHTPVDANAEIGTSCVPDCFDRVCGGDGCGGSCGICTGGACGLRGTCEPRGETFVLDARGPLRRNGSRRFGHTLALSGNGRTLVVADGSNFVEAYERQGLAWVNTGTFSPNYPTDSFSKFGFAVAISSDGGTIAIGDYRGGPMSPRYGHIDVYTKSGVQWAGPVALVRPIGAVAFGKSIALSGDGNVLIAGDPGALRPPGTMVSVFTRIAGVWSSGIVLADPAGSNNDFGDHLGLSANGQSLVAWGRNQAAYNPMETGRISSFVNNGSGWTVTTAIMPPVGTIFPYAGRARLALSSDGFSLAVPTGANTIHLYHRRADGPWLPTETVTANGKALALSHDGRTLVAGTRGEFSNFAAQVTVLNRVAATTWTTQTLTTPNQISSFGSDVGISADGSTLAIADYRTDNASGAVYVYTR